MHESSYLNSSLILGAAMLLATSLAPAATTVEQWTFDGASPETGINGGTIDKWTTTTPNSVPSAGVLRYATSGNSNSLSLGGIDTSTLSLLRMTVSVSDFLIGVGTDTGGQPNSTGSDTIAFQIATNAGSLELELNAFQSNGQFAPDLEQGLGSTSDLDVSIMNWADQSAISPLVLVSTWDFVNNTMALEWSGTKSGSQSVPAANLANIFTIDTFRVRGGSRNFGTLLDLDSVTIETIAIPEPSASMLLGMGLTAVILRRRPRRQR